MNKIEFINYVEPKFDMKELNKAIDIYLFVSFGHIFAFCLGCIGFIYYEDYTFMLINLISVFGLKIHGARFVELTKRKKYETLKSTNFNGKYGNKNK